MWLVFLFVVPILALDMQSYYKERNSLIAKEESMIAGANIILNDKERKANDILMKVKLEEYNHGLKEPSEFLPAFHFFGTKDRISNSTVYKIMKILPKGAALHLHDTSQTSFDVLYKFTYKDNLYACTDDQGQLRLKFFKNADKNCDWQSVQQLRQTNSSFEEYLKSQFTLIVENPEQKYTDTNAVWVPFGNALRLSKELLTYEPMWKEYFYNTLKELYEDNVMYAEIRTTLPELYDLDDMIYGPLDVADIYKQTLRKFKQDYPDFQGAKLIYTGVRHADNKTIRTYGPIVFELHKQYKDFFAGFDLAAQETKGNPNIDFIPLLLEMKEKGIQFFFHAGETNWYGAFPDQNVIDAVLLGSKRIGHGFAVIKHPEVMRLIKEKDIAIEVMPISNQVLTLVKDIRNHPANYYIGNGIPVVICNDNEAYFGSKGLSYDWYMTFMGMTSRSSDLRFLKQMAINSIQYSAMNATEKETAFEDWGKRWGDFIENVINENF